jgi:predicted RNA-binding protein
MAAYLNLFSPETYEIFGQAKSNISGFRVRHRNAASKIHTGDKLLCYMTKLSRWVGILEVKSEAYFDETPLYYSENDPFVIRFEVKRLAWLPIEKKIPIHEPEVWNTLSFTRHHKKNSYQWTGKVRTSLVRIDDRDAEFLEILILRQLDSAKVYSVDQQEYQKLTAHKVHRSDKVISVSIPDDSGEASIIPQNPTEIRESLKMQALIAKIGVQMGMRIWIPRNDRGAVLENMESNDIDFLETLPLNYDEATLKTIEQIDVLWLKQRSIVRAFEVEHTTSIYSGILRMADLLALQPNMDIKLHIVAPASRRDKVFQEITRPVFSLLERGPLSESCTYLSYDSLKELSEIKHLNRMSDDVLEDYAEEVD